MTRNILLTSPDALENDKPLRYYSFPNEAGRGFCEALQSMEASTRYLLSCFPFDEILVIGRENQSDGAEDEKPVLLKDAGALYGADPNTLSAFNLYRSRVAQFIDGLSLEQQEAEELLPEEERAKLISFIEGFAKRCSKQINILFDELSSSFPLYEQFKDELSDALPEIRDHSLPVMKWIKNYLYTQLKSSAKLEIFPGNEKVRARYVPVAMLESRDYWINNVLNINQDVHDGNDEINIYIALGTSPAINEHLISNILSLLIYLPGSNVRLRKTYKVFEPSWILSGKIEDSTAITRSTDLASAARAFLNYSKTDMLMDFWNHSGEKNERISNLIYAAQHVDMGISMCNLLEVKEGIRQLRELLLEDRPWVEDGDYGYLFGLIAGCITADYGPLLESDDNISFFELIKWAYRHQLLQQVLTLIESHAPENLVDSGIFYYCDDEKNVPAVIDLLVEQRMELKPYEYYKMDDIDHYFIKNYDRGSVRIGRGEDRSSAYATLRAQSIQNQDPEKITGYTACDSIDTVKNVLYAYFNLGSVRNKISHSDFADLARKNMIVGRGHTSYAMTLMMESIERFIISYEKALEEVRGKNPKIVKISGNDVRRAAEAQRPPFTR